ncbi:hypothetical protein A3Q56_06206 [Intoshia linei]|uniref:Uncharacterized protein n=1 Tax=Intoshia linei TaxID=1819745 RepID=A0A177AVN4_9BILA|nr:hypothetical protein A3Q56_06206 [Intoshia linei]
MSTLNLGIYNDSHDLTPIESFSLNMDYAKSFNITNYVSWSIDFEKTGSVSKARWMFHILYCDKSYILEFNQTDELKAADTQKARINDMSMIFAWESTSTINPIFTRIYNCDKLKLTLYTDYFIKDVKCVKNALSVNDPA